MKNIFLKATVACLTFAGALCAIEAAVEPKPVVQQYDHRMVVFHPGYHGYEYMPNDDLYVGVHLSAIESYDAVHRKSAMLGSFEAQLGRSYFYNGKDHVRPVIGGGIYRDFSVQEAWLLNDHAEGWMLIEQTKRPAIGYGLVGCMLEREFTDRLALGLNAKVMVGGIAGKRYDETKNVFYGADVSVPLTIRMGATRNWDLRLEPFALVMNDGSRYLGHRSAIAYRF